MHSRFDRRVLSERELAFVRACQERVPCHLAGGAALSGAYLSHRLSADIDLFCHEAGLRDFPVEPLPIMLKPLTVAELREYRDRLAQRFRELAVTPPDPRS